MNRLFIFFIFFILPAYSQVQVSIDTANKKQKITGLGACTGKANINLHLYDLGSSMIRLSLLGVHGLEGAQNDNNDPGSLDLSKFIWPQDLIDVALEAKKMNTKVIVNSFSPPAWMKTNNNINNGGSLIDSMYSEFGEWVLGCMQSFKVQAGYDVYAFGTQNEPEFVEPYASCVYSADQLMRASKEVGKRFAAAGLPTQIFHGEALFTQGRVLNFCQAVNNDDSCKNYVDAFAIHISDNDGLNPGGTTSQNYKMVYAECQRVDPIKEFWLTENSSSDGYKVKSMLNMQGAMLDACNYYNGLKYGNLSAWLFCANNTKSSAHVYYLNKQMIRFIRPNSLRLESTSNDNDVLVLSFKNDSLKSSTIVLINKSTSDKTANIDFPGATGNFDIYRTSEKDYCKYIGKTNLLNLSIPALSISSLVYVEQNNIPLFDKLDTIVVLQNTTGKINLTGINDGGEGNQTVSFSIESAANYFNYLNVIYSSPSTIGEISYSLKDGITGHTFLYLTADDHSPVFDGMYSQNQQIINFISIPYINYAPRFDSIADQVFSGNQFNVEQSLYLTGVNDGNGGKQKLSLTVASSNSNIVSVGSVGYSALKLVPKENGTATITVTLRDDGNTYKEYKSGIRGQNLFARTFKVVCGTGINDANVIEERIIRVYPVPANNLLYIMNPDCFYNFISILDVSGKIVNAQLLKDEITIIKTESLHKGVYFLRFANNYKVEVQKIIIE